MIKRIESQKSNYSTKHWDFDRKITEKYICNISQFPFKEYKPTKTMVQLIEQNLSNQIIRKQTSTTRNPD